MPKHSKPERNAKDKDDGHGHSLDIFALIISIVAVVVSYLSYRAASEQVSIEKDTARKQLRAWVLLDNVYWVNHAESDSIVRLDLRWSNCGQTPATNVAPLLWLALAKETPDSVPPSPPREIGGSPFLKPSDPVKNEIDIPIPAAHMKSILGGHLKLFVFVHFEYTDIFGDLDSTNALMEWDETIGHFRAARKHNFVK